MFFYRFSDTSNEIQIFCLTYCILAHFLVIASIIAITSMTSSSSTKVSSAAFVIKKVPFSLNQVDIVEQSLFESCQCV